MSSNTLHEDRYIRIQENKIEIKNYYFPFCCKKIILIKEIKSITLKQIESLLCSSRVWGPNCNYNWFSLDCKRNSKKYYIEIDIGSCLNPTFTVDKTEVVYNIILKLLSKNKEANTEQNILNNKIKEVNNFLN